MLQSFFFTYCSSTINPSDLPIVWELTQPPLVPWVLFQSTTRISFPAQHPLSAQQYRQTHPFQTEHVQPTLMPAPLPPFLQLSATFRAVSSRILFCQVSAPTFSCLSSRRSHSCSLQQSGRCPLSPASFCPPQTQTQLSCQDTHMKDGWIDFFPSNRNFCLNFIHFKNANWSAYISP